MKKIPSESSPRSEVQSLLLAILLFQRKNGYIYSAWGKLRLVEHQLLIELDRSPLARSVDLSIILNQSAANISHILKSLRRRGLVREIEGDTEREKLILLTRAGKVTISDLDDLSNQLMNSLAESLSDLEQSQIYGLWESINDALRSPRTVVGPGDHPFRIQTRRFTRAFGFLSRKPGESVLSFPEIHILFALKLEQGGILLGELAQMLQVPVSTLQKNLTKLYTSGLCTAPTEKRGKTIQITELGAQAFEKTVQELSRQLLDTFDAARLDTIVNLLPLFERMITTWNPTYLVPPREYRVQTGENFFTRLQILHLTEYAQRHWGIMPTLTKDGESAQRSIVIYRGPTPCFCLKFKNLQGVISLEEFGCSPSVNWKDVVKTLCPLFVTANRNSKEIVLQTTMRTAALRSLLSFEGAHKSKFAFGDLPPSKC